MKKSKSLFLSVVLGGIILIFWYYKLPPLKSFSLNFNDLKYTFQTQKPDSSVVFVAIDEKSVNSLGRWPWDRTQLIPALEQLQQAKVVVFDMIFSEPTDEEKDIALGEAIAELPNSVCGFFLRQKATQHMSEYQAELMQESSLERLNANNYSFVQAPYVEANIEEVLENCSMNAAFSTLRDEDHLFRQYPIAFVLDGNIYPSLGVQALRLLYNADVTEVGKNVIALNNKEIEVNDKGFILLNYYNANDYAVHSFLDVYEKKIDASYFKDKIVILGITEAGVEDVRGTPIGAIPGPLLHYTFLSNYFQDILLHNYLWLDGLIIVLFLLLPWVVHKYVAYIEKRVIIYLIAYVVYFFISKMAYVSFNLWLDTFYPLISLLGILLIKEAMAFIDKEEESKFIKNAFSSYISPELVQRLVKNPNALSLSGQKKELSVLFSDIRSFTSISERTDAEQLGQMLNEYFTPMTKAVMDNEGTLDKFIGDAVMAFFNAPADVEEHAKKACQSALDMIDKLEVLNKNFAKKGWSEFEVGIGINTDEVIVGNLGSKERFNYTVIGDGVNLASRVEGLTKTFKTKILITQSTYEQVKSSFLCRKLEAVQVKGKKEPVVMYELMKNTKENQEIKICFEEACQLCQNNKLKEGRERLQMLADTYNDLVSKTFLEKEDAELKSMQLAMKSK